MVPSLTVSLNWTHIANEKFLWPHNLRLFSICEILIPTSIRYPSFVVSVQLYDVFQRADHDMILRLGHGHLSENTQRAPFGPSSTLGSIRLDLIAKDTRLTINGDDPDEGSANEGMFRWDGKILFSISSKGF